MFQVLMTIPETKVFIDRSYNNGTGFSEDELTILNNIKAQVTDNICWNTKIYKNEKVVCLVGSCTLAELDGYISTLSLDWLILAASDSMVWDEEQQKYVKQLLVNFKYNKLKKFLVDETVVDGEEEFGRFMGDIILEGED